MTVSLLRLQDAMGSGSFPAVLQYLQEPYEDRPMPDKLNRLGKLGWRDITGMANMPPLMIKLARLGHPRYALPHLNPLPEGEEANERDRISDD